MEKRHSLIKAQGNVLFFDLKERKGALVVNLNISHNPSSFKMEFDVFDLAPKYARLQPSAGDRVGVDLRCGQDSLPWYIIDNSINLICRAKPIKNANQS